MLQDCDVAKETFLNRFPFGALRFASCLHFGLLRSPSVEMTNVQMIIVVGKVAKYDIRNTNDELSYLSALEEGYC
jgi:hypothetical protein